MRSVHCAPRGVNRHAWHVATIQRVNGRSTSNVRIRAIVRPCRVQEEWDVATQGSHVTRAIMVRGSSHATVPQPSLRLIRRVRGRWLPGPVDL
jgi:hypothetical protein